MERSCPACGSPLKANADFCPACGVNLQHPTATKTHAGTPLTGGQRAGTASWEELRRLIGFYALFLVISLFNGLIGDQGMGPVMDVVFSTLWAVTALVFLAVEWKRSARAFRWRKPKPKTLAGLFAACVAVYFFLQGYFAVFTYFGWPFINMTESYTTAHWPFWTIFVSFCVVPGIFEELAFRGVILTRLSQILSRREAWIIQAAAFSVLHLSPAIFISHFVMGLLLGWIRLRTGHVYFGMLIHAAWNYLVIMEELGR